MIVISSAASRRGKYETLMMGDNGFLRPHVFYFGVSPTDASLFEVVDFVLVAGGFGFLNLSGHFVAKRFLL